MLGRSIEEFNNPNNWEISQSGKQQNLMHYETGKEQQCSNLSLEAGIKTKAAGWSLRTKWEGLPSGGWNHTEFPEA